ncbi:Crp/Fnr family transcriptional regulator [Rhodohalobacter sulfatireducens]|uniref:Crp/Fnr family transcriptional regulator n=1 Tax=Rhodohalobacter sulfatireducens TaxID=2911366 RepID=A0ABS9KDJ7_9BACT|nr:Crp/Fnr family transcriptional regulator [Rhodohalobacter sulfatireducens]MCG2588941.1 Crp/Fnr family transcriptional regulator [Rhodohalobacter sulfatireducens]
MVNKQKLLQVFPHLNSELILEIEDNALKKDIPKGTEILREGQYVSVVPIVMDGLIKVFKQYEERDLLLYYIKPNESCIMSFAAGLKNEPSNVFAQTEEDTTALLLPVKKIFSWIKEYPELNSLFFQQYNIRYSELLETIQHVLFNKMDQRLYDYLREKIDLLNKNPLKISHRQIASDLGTAREVVSRVMKKLEQEGKVKQQANGIEILKW